jgi:hypothetical protein
VKEEVIFRETSEVFQQIEDEIENERVYACINKKKHVF